MVGSTSRSATNALGLADGDEAGDEAGDADEGGDGAVPAEAPEGKTVTVSRAAAATARPRSAAASLNMTLIYQPRSPRRKTCGFRHPLRAPAPDTPPHPRSAAPRPPRRPPAPT